MVLNLAGEYTVKSKQALLFESFFSVIILLLTFITPIFSTYILIIFGWLTFTDLAKKKTLDQITSRDNTRPIYTPPQRPYLNSNFFFFKL